MNVQDYWMSRRVFVGSLAAALAAAWIAPAGLHAADKAALRKTIPGTAETLDDRPYNNSYCWIIRLRDGQFAEVTEYLDTELVTRVFG